MGLEPTLPKEPVPKTGASAKFRQKAILYCVVKMGLEPTRPEGHSDLNAARLPIPPLNRKRIFVLSMFLLYQTLFVCVKLL
jgi:hypothetical protein